MRKSIFPILLLLLSLCGEVKARQVSDSLLATLDAHTILLDYTLTPSEVSACGHVYATLQEAVAHLQDGTEEQPMRLLIAPGVYWADDPDDPAIRQAEGADHGVPYGMTIRCEHLHIEGLTSDPRDVILASNRGQTQGALGNYTMFRIIGDDIQARNVTFGNYCNVDLEYPRHPAFNRQRRADAIVQAQLVHVKADRVFCDNCRFVSRLNLCPMTGARRTLFRNCHFESTNDALAGSAVYLHCHFTFFAGMPWYATPAWGAVLLDCDIDTHVRGQQYFSKAGGAITIIDSRFRTLYDPAGSPLSVNWTPNPNVVSYQHNVSLNGYPLSIGDADSRVDLDGHALLYAYRVPKADGSILYNIPNLLAGNDNWDPLNLRPDVLAEERRLGIHLLGLPTWMRIKASSSSLPSQDATSDLQAELRRWADYDVDSTIAAEVMAGGIRWSGSTALALSDANDERIVATSRNTLPERVDAKVEASVISGLRASTTLAIGPSLREAPDFDRQPQLSEDEDKGNLALYYDLNRHNSEDHSLITWYRYKKSDLSDTIPFRQGHASPDLKKYKISGADVGWNIAVRVVPQLRDSRASSESGLAHTDIIDYRKVNLFQLRDVNMVEDFSRLPLKTQPLILPGFWTLDAVKPDDTKAYQWTPDPEHPWYYGTAPDGAEGQGLVEASRGARARYTPLQKTTRGQTVILRLDPCKTAGQGFGSATGQYFDIFIKMDHTTQTGYALRIARSPRYDRAVVFTLMKYTNGIAKPLTDEVPSSCFRSTCVVTLKYSNGTLSAHAETTNASPSWDTSSKEAPILDLSVKVEKNKFGGIGFLHTGSIGASAIMIHSLEAKWR